MKLDDIMNEWEEDSNFSRSEMKDAMMNLAFKHSKYSRYLALERGAMKLLKIDYERFRAMKSELYLTGFHEGMPEEWRPDETQQKVLKADIPHWLAKDEENVKWLKRIAACEERVEYLKDVLKMIHNLGFTFQAWSSALKWESGG